MSTWILRTYLWIRWAQLDDSFISKLMCLDRLGVTWKLAGFVCCLNFRTWRVWLQSLHEWSYLYGFSQQLPVSVCSWLYRQHMSDRLVTVIIFNFTSLILPFTKLQLWLKHEFLFFLYSLLKSNIWTRLWGEEIDWDFAFINLEKDNKHLIGLWLEPKTSGLTYQCSITWAIQSLGGGLSK